MTLAEQDTGMKFMFMANILVGGQINSFSFFVVPFIKPAWCGEISLYSGLKPNNNTTKVESTGKMKNGYKT